MKAAVKILEGRLEAAEVDETKVKELQETVERLDMAARQKNLKIENAEKMHLMLMGELQEFKTKSSLKHSSEADGIHARGMACQRTSILKLEAQVTAGESELYS